MKNRMQLKSMSVCHIIINTDEDIVLSRIAEPYLQQQLRFIEKRAGDKDIHMQLFHLTSAVGPLSLAWYLFASFAATPRSRSEVAPVTMAVIPSL
jgi:hypothetical protein